MPESREKNLSAWGCAVFVSFDLSSGHAENPFGFVHMNTTAEATDKAKAIIRAAKLHHSNLLGFLVLSRLAVLSFMFKEVKFRPLPLCL